MKKMKKISVFIIVMTLFSCSTVLAEEGPEIEVRSAEIIIKVAPGTITMPEGHYRSPLSDVDISSDALIEINKKFNLISIEKMFARKAPEDKAGEGYQEEEPARSGEEEGTDLENIFILKFPDNFDPYIIIKELEMIKDVVYAEKNEIVTIF